MNQQLFGLNQPQIVPQHSNLVHPTNNVQQGYMPIGDQMHLVNHQPHVQQ
jgi:hypothetical protein